MTVQELIDRLIYEDKNAEVVIEVAKGAFKKADYDGDAILPETLNLDDVLNEDVTPINTVILSLI